MLVTLDFTRVCGYLSVFLFMYRIYEWIIKLVENKMSNITWY